MIFALVCVINALQRIDLAKISFKWWTNACPHAWRAPGVEIKGLMEQNMQFLRGSRRQEASRLKMAKSGMLGWQAQVMVRG